MAALNELRDTPSGTFRITAEGAARQLFAPIIIGFLQRFPTMKVDLVTEGRLIDIVSEGFDLGVRMASLVPQDMVAIPCGPRQRAVGSRKYFKRHAIPIVPGDLAEHNCIRRRYPSGALQPWEFNRDGEAVTIEVEGTLTLGSHSLMVEAALRGMGIAYVGEWFAAPHVAKRRLIRVLEDWTLSFGGLCAYYPTIPKTGICPPDFAYSSM
jgi:DNA-binding transcriptional LysR family regulator